MAEDQRTIRRELVEMTRENRALRREVMENRTLIEGLTENLGREVDDRVGAVLNTVCVSKTNSFLGSPVEGGLQSDGDCL